MSGFDKGYLMERLVELGWTEVEDAEKSPYQMAPPAALWEQKPRSFYVYDAETIQELFAPGSTVEDDAGDWPGEKGE